MSKFNRFKVNCSDLPDLMAREQGNNPPTDKEFSEFLKIIEKDMVDITLAQQNKLQQMVLKTVNYDAWGLSTTARKAIYKQYAYSKFGIGKISASGRKPMQLEKGEIAEPDAIKLLSKLDGVEYSKNEKMYSNKWFKGIPDILLKEGDDIIGVKDVKIALDAIDFLEKVDGESASSDRWEMLGYLDILDLKEGEICYCLVNLPDQMKEARLKEHESRLTLAGATKRHTKRTLLQIEKSMVYDYIPEELRIKKFTVHRKGYFTKQAHSRVKLVRDRLNRVDSKFLQNILVLQETTEPLEDIS